MGALRSGRGHNPHGHSPEPDEAGLATKQETETIEKKAPLTEFEGAIEECVSALELYAEWRPLED